MASEEEVKKFADEISKIKQEIHKDVIGQDEVIDNVIIAIISGGNVLLEGVPGVGKTRLVRFFITSNGFAFFKNPIYSRFNAFRCYRN